MCLVRGVHLVLLGREEKSWKQEQKLEKLSVVNEALVIWGQLLEKLLFLACH